jgi:hypothetical protein
MATFTVKAVSSEWDVKQERGKTTGRTVYEVYASEPVTPLAAKIGAGITVGSDYPETTGNVLPCVDVTCRAKDQTRMVFRVEANFDSSNEFLPNPLSEPTKYDYEPEGTEETFYKDETPGTAKLARHTNGIPFTELPKRQRSIRTISIEKNVATSNTMGTYDAFQDKVNDGSVTIDGVTYAARTLFIASVGLSSVKTTNGVQYKTLKVVIKGKRDTWDQKYESIGVQELANGELKQIVDPNGNPVQQPWPLTQNGAKAATQATEGFEIVLRPYPTLTNLNAIT